MAKSKITGVDAVLAKLTALKRPLSYSEADNLGKSVVLTMKDLISKGISPILGNGRFPAYKNPDRYPGNRKPKSPVNLYLKGDFLNSLGSRVVDRPGGFSAEISYSSDQDIKETGHREGANGQPKRPTIPRTSDGERFSQTIQQAYLKIIFDAVSRITKGR